MAVVKAVVPHVAIWRRIVSVLGAVLITAAAVVGSYPFLSDMNEQRMSHEQFYQAVDSSMFDEESVSQSFSSATTYNEVIAGEKTPEEVGDLLLPYAGQLTLQSATIMCWLDIPKLGLKQPVYHNTTDEILMMGAGHIERTSLPVGGPSTNVAITGHSGMPNTRMFDQLDRLEPGDIFILWTLGRPLAYEVQWSRLVEPDDSSVLNIVPGEDLATLVTCRPIGVNTHRLIVRGQRTNYDASMADEDISYLADPRTALFVTALGLVGAGVFVPLLLLLFRPRATWWLSGVIGSRTVSSAEVAAMEKAHGEDMKLTFKSLGRLEFNAFGDVAYGRWSRVPGDPAKAIVRFAENVTTGQATLECEGDIGEIVLPKGENVLSVQDGRVVIEADYGNTELVFERGKLEDG